MKNDVKFCHDLLILISFAFIQNQQLSLKLQNENYRGTDWIFICSTQKANKSYGFPITWGWFCLAFILLHFCFLSTSTLSSSLLRLLISNSLVFCNRSFSANRPEFGFLLGWTTFALNTIFSLRFGKVFLFLATGCSFASPWERI